MNGLRAGGLAMIVGLRVHTYDNGKVVSLVELLEPGAVFHHPVNQRLNTNMAGRPVWLVTGNLRPTDGPDTKSDEAGWALIAPVNLMPINPDELPVEEQDREAVL